MAPSGRLKTTLLIVEDNPVDAELLRHGLEEAGVDADVVTASDVRSACNRLDRWSERGVTPGLVVLDMDLHGRSGLAVLDHIRSSRGMGRVAVVVLTGSQDERHIAAAKVAGAATYYIKPRDLDGFLSLGKELALFWLDRPAAVAQAGHWGGP